MDSFRYNTERQLPICVTHGHGILLRALVRQLAEEHRDLSLSDCRHILEKTREKWPLASLGTIPVPTAGLMPIAI